MNQYCPICENHATLSAYIEWAVRRVKLDLELIKEILIEVEKLEVRIPKTIKVEGHDPIVVSRHIEMLYDNGLIEGIPSSTMASAVKDIMIKDMSLDGHHLLAALRNDTVFAKLKSALSPSMLAVLTLKQITSLASEVGLKVVRNTLGLD